MMKEHPVYKGYLITEDGRVFTCKKKGCIDLSVPVEMSLYLNKDGYFRTTLQISGKTKTVFVHRLVAETYINNLNNLPQVNHIDENKQNNNVNNLEWVTSKQNSEHSHCRHIWEIQNVFTKEVYVTKNVRHFCRERGLSSGTLSRTFNNDKKHHKGYKILSKTRFK